MEDCIFCKIVRREIPKEFAYEDEDILAFDDIYPKAPIHLIIIPKIHIADFFEVDDDKIHIKISRAIQQLIKKTGLDTKGYKVEVNGGGFQDIFHLHFHLTGPKNRQ
jgi:histidine triad (HIT) family protein